MSDLLPKGTPGGKKQRQNKAHRYDIAYDNDYHGFRYAMEKWNLDANTLLNIIEMVDEEKSRRRGGMSPIDRLSHRQDYHESITKKSIGNGSWKEPR